MAGLTVKVDKRLFEQRIDALLAGLSDARSLMQVWGEIAVTSIQENFEQGGRPQKWQPLPPVTISMKGHDRALIGRTGNLARVGYRAASDHVVIGTNPASKDYAAIQHFGGMAGRNRKVKIPARPFMLLQDEDVVEMEQVSRAYLQRIGGAV